MSIKDPRTVAKRWYEEVWNNKREEVIDEMCGENCIVHGLVDDYGNQIVGPEGFKPYFRKFIRSFPDVTISVEDVIAEGDLVATRCKVIMTHSGDDLQISPGKIIRAPSKKQRIEFTGMTFTTIRNGKIQEGWNNWDFMSMYVQMNAVNFI